MLNSFGFLKNSFAFVTFVEGRLSVAPKKNEIQHEQTCNDAKQKRFYHFRRHYFTQEVRKYHSQCCHSLYIRSRSIYKHSDFIVLLENQFLSGRNFKFCLGSNTLHAEVNSGAQVTQKQERDCYNMS